MNRKTFYCQGSPVEVTFSPNAPGWDRKSRLGSFRYRGRVGYQIWITSTSKRYLRLFRHEWGHIIGWNQYCNLSNPNEQAREVYDSETYADLQSMTLLEYEKAIAWLKKCHREAIA